MYVAGLLVFVLIIEAMYLPMWIGYLIAFSVLALIVVTVEVVPFATGIMGISVTRVVAR